MTGLALGNVIMTERVHDLDLPGGHERRALKSSKFQAPSSREAPNIKHRAVMDVLKVRLPTASRRAEARPAKQTKLSALRFRSGAHRATRCSSNRREKAQTKVRASLSRLLQILL
jgi:hypothetical protein